METVTDDILVTRCKRCTFRKEPGRPPNEALCLACTNDLREKAASYGGSEGDIEDLFQTYKKGFA